MGSDRHYPEEAPARQAAVADFWIDRTPVTNRQFRKFVNETGHVTLAELPPDAKDYPGALPEMLKAGSLIFASPRGPVDLRDWSQWWQFKFGANWRRPYGPRSSISGLDDHPVVHIAYRDAEAYAQWAGKALPTEAEWEFAARGGLDGAEFAWGEEFAPGGKHQANTWQGEFPQQNLAIDGYERTSPVTAFPANGYGLYDTIGNVWEWTADWFAPQRDANAQSPCCAPERSRWTVRRATSDFAASSEQGARHVRRRHGREVSLKNSRPQSPQHIAGQRHTCSRFGARHGGARSTRADATADGIGAAAEHPRHHG